MEVSTTTNILNAGFRRDTTASDLLNTNTFGIGNANRVSSTNTSQTAALDSGFQQASDFSAPVNAFGIGQANQPEVELSPQARILQQNEDDQAQRVEQREAREAQAEEQENQQQEQEEQSGGFVRLSTSEGNVSRSNLEAQKAAEVYRTIQNLV
ncbi:MAG: hypothetical protein GJ680_13800 [Alteromonadaceae bacterium]|nr:hypothetical protein [Alteromonadaceae bacterium]